MAKTTQAFAVPKFIEDTPKDCGESSKKPLIVIDASEKSNLDEPENQQFTFGGPNNLQLNINEQSF